MVERQVDDRILRRGEDLADLVLPVLPRVAAPEVVGPQEAALEQILAQPLHFVVIEIERPDLRHHDERTLEELVVGEPDDEVIRLAFARRS